MIGLRCTLVLAVLLLGYTPSCLGQDEGEDSGPPGQRPQGPPPARNVRRQEEQGDAPMGQRPQGDPTGNGNRMLGSFLRSREASLEEQDESLQRRDYGFGAKETRYGSKCTKEMTNGKLYGNSGCYTYPESFLTDNVYLWCYREEGSWDSCCYGRCLYYEPSWGSPYYYCYINNDGRTWDYCDPDEVNVI